MENQNDFWLPSQSFLTIEGQIVRNPNDSTIAFCPNGLLQLFSECKYLLNGVEIDHTRGLGLATTLKGYCNLTPDEMLSYHHAGWGEFPDTLTTGVEHRFKACIPLKFLLGFAEDYTKILLGCRQELILTRAGHDKNALWKTLPTRTEGVTEANYKTTIANYKAAELGTVTISKMTWNLASIAVADKARITLLQIINNDIPITIGFRSWQYFEHPSVPSTKEFKWTITSATQLERPRFIIVAFQTDRKDNVLAQANHFDHVNVTDVKVFLNSDSFPYSNLTLDFKRNKYGPAYQMFHNFQSTYYNETHRVPA